MRLIVKQAQNPGIGGNCRILRAYLYDQRDRTKINLFYLKLEKILYEMVLKYQPHHIILGVNIRMISSRASHMHHGEKAECRTQLLTNLWFVAVYDEGDQLVLLVGLQHDVRDGGRRAGHPHLEIVQSLLVILLTVDIRFQVNARLGYILRSSSVSAPLPLLVVDTLHYHL